LGACAFVGWTPETEMRDGRFQPPYTPVALSLILRFPWLLGAGMGGREWHTAPWGHRQPPFTPMIGRIHASLN
jgi:hypothetical protein